jgi:hypothetical protein
LFQPVINITYACIIIIYLIYSFKGAFSSHFMMAPCVRIVVEFSEVNVIIFRIV